MFKLPTKVEKRKDKWTATAPTQQGWWWCYFTMDDPTGPAWWRLSTIVARELEAGGWRYFLDGEEFDPEAVTAVWRPVEVPDVPSDKKLKKMLEVK